jgi:hypothetical protein
MSGTPARSRSTPAAPVSAGGRRSGRRRAAGSSGGGGSRARLRRRGRRGWWSSGSCPRPATWCLARSRRCTGPSCGSGPGRCPTGAACAPCAVSSCGCSRSRSRCGRSAAWAAQGERDQRAPLRDAEDAGEERRGLRAALAVARRGQLDPAFTRVDARAQRQVGALFEHDVALRARQAHPDRSARRPHGDALAVHRRRDLGARRRSGRGGRRGGRRRRGRRRRERRRHHERPARHRRVRARGAHKERVGAGRQWSVGLRRGARVPGAGAAAAVEPTLEG